MDFIYKIIAAAIIYGGALGIVVLIWKIRENRLKLNGIAEKEFSLLEILVPKNNERGPLSAENLYATLHGIYDIHSKIQEHISFELISQDQTIKFFVYVPSHLKDFVEGQIYAQYPTVEIKEVPDYTSKLKAPVVAGAELVLNKNDVFPIKTFESFEVDPLAGITGVLSKVGIGEQVWIQVIMRPVADTWQKKGIAYIDAIRNGISPNSNIRDSVVKGLMSIAGEVVKSASGPTEKKPEKTGNIKLSGPEEVALKGIETKVAKLGFETKIRILSISSEPSISRSKVIGVVSAFKQFNMTNLNGFSSTPVIIGEQIVGEYRNRNIGSTRYILNIQELASIYHLPSENVATPSISWAGSKKGEPPVNLPIEGIVEPNDLTLFGQTNFRHLIHRFGIKSLDRRLHFYAIGKTGTGKSTLLENMIIDDIREGRGVAVVDPHGDLIDQILDFIPDERIEDVVYFAPADREHPVGFNILENVDPDLKSIVASGVVGIFEKIFGETSWGPRLEYILRNTVFSLLDYPNATMLGITTMLVDKTFRSKVVAEIDDPVIKNFWVNEFEKYDQKFRTEAVAPIQNKVGQFLSSSTIRNIVGQPKSTMNIREIMDTKKILLLDLSMGKIGEDSAALLGAMMITKIQLSAMERASIAEKDRIDFYLYVDEFQNFATESFATILSEARKYRLNLIMTNQYIAQMPDVVQQAVFGNVGTIVSFRIGAQDASALVKEFEPVFDANDLVNLNNYNIYVKMAIDGVTCPAFSSLTLPPYTEKTGNRDKIIEFSRNKYSKDREQVEKEMIESVELSSGGSGEEVSENQKVRYPREIENNYIELKDPKTNQLFYSPGRLSGNEATPEETKPASAKNGLASALDGQGSGPLAQDSQPDVPKAPIEPGILEKRIQATTSQQANKVVKAGDLDQNDQIIPYKANDDIQPIEDSTTIDL